MDKILTVCPYCGSGCKLNLLVEDGEIVGAQPANGVTNQGELCLKGYYGWDFLNDTRLLTPRLTTPYCGVSGARHFSASAGKKPLPLLQPG